MTEEQLRANIAKNITELRKASDITQAELAEMKEKLLCELNRLLEE